MKKFISVTLLLIFFAAAHTQAQESATYFKKKFTVGIDLFTDVWTGVPAIVSSRTINQGANFYSMYNFPLGQKKTGKAILAVGLGIGTHNFYSTNGYIENIKADTINFVNSAVTGLNFTKSKLNVTTLDIPLELKVKLKKGWHFGVGLKINYLIDSKETYIGATELNGPSMKIKYKKVNYLNSTGYTPTLRFGHNSFNIYAAYQLIPLFQTGHGPAMHPISLGITITPF
ncbi:MAG: outer membrane beta-barrel protein [Bacteroidales bacterium]|nr:outer membrane beta-barrel protein [Bacteroidales bacterium]